MTKSRILWIALGILGVAVVVLNMPIATKLPQKKMTAPPVDRLDLSSFSTQPLPRPLDALFIHPSLLRRPVAGPLRRGGRRTLHLSVSPQRRQFAPSPGTEWLPRSRSFLRVASGRTHRCIQLAVEV